MNTHEKLKVTCLHHPCTASHSVRKLLEKELGFVYEKAHHTTPARRLEGWTYFTVVRNHWDALTTWFFRTHGQSAEAVMNARWLDDWLDQHENYHEDGRLWFHLGRIPHRDLVVLRFENLEEDLRLLLGTFGLTFHSLPRENVGMYRNGQDYHKVMTLGCADRIYEVFRHEILELDYRF